MVLESLFSKYLKQFMPKLQRLIETTNGKHENLTYLYKQHLRTEYSIDNKWESTTADTTYVAADFVSMDSPLPIKMRDSIATANGKLPKIGISRILKESDINALRIMEAQSGNSRLIAKKLANDPIACSNGIDERNEFNFLYGFSRGYVAIADADNDGKLLRLNFRYFEKNIYHATEKGQIDLEDILHVIEEAEGNGDIITKIWMAKTTYDRLRQTRKAKELAANYDGRIYTDDTSLPVPIASKFDEAFADETGGVEIIKVNRSVITEADGKRQSVKPWDENRVIFVTSDTVGTLIYGRLAEQDNPVEGVLYQTIDSYKLIARFRETNPLRETTTGQAMVAPVIENVDQLYVLDLTQSAEVDEQAEAADTQDIYITWNKQKYNKEQFVNVLNGYANTKLTKDSTDGLVIKTVNKLNEEQLAKFSDDVASAIVN
jgi:hypothetical protein